jgi:hypothetical protein
LHGGLGNDGGGGLVQNGGVITLKEGQFLRIFSRKKSSLNYRLLFAIQIAAEF